MEWTDYRPLLYLYVGLSWFWHRLPWITFAVAFISFGFYLGMCMNNV